jgi:hypothetical protein
MPVREVAEVLIRPDPRFPDEIFGQKIVAQKWRAPPDRVAGYAGASGFQNQPGYPRGMRLTISSSFIDRCDCRRLVDHWPSAAVFETTSMPYIFG